VGSTHARGMTEAHHPTGDSDGCRQLSGRPARGKAHSDQQTGQLQSQATFFGSAYPLCGAEPHISGRTSLDAVKARPFA
jgi:hypothetical protein